LILISLCCQHGASILFFFMQRLLSCYYLWL
jgi:hypothetical protein